MFTYTIAAGRKIISDIKRIIMILVITHMIFNISKGVYSLIINVTNNNNFVLDIIIIMLNSIIGLIQIILRKPNNKISKLFKKGLKKQKRIIKIFSGLIESILTVILSFISCIGQVINTIIIIFMIIVCIIFLINIVLFLISKYIEYELEYIENGLKKDFERVITVINKVSNDKFDIEPADEKIINELNQYLESDKYESLYYLYIKKAKKLIKHKKEIKKLLETATYKFEKLVFPGKTLSYIPIFIKKVREYIGSKKDRINKKTAIKMLAAIKYFEENDDLLKDEKLIVGYNDDKKIIKLCLSEINLKDLELEEEK